MTEASGEQATGSTENSQTVESSVAENNTVPQVQLSASDLEDMKQQIAMLASQMGQITEALRPKQEPLTAEQQAQLLIQNPTQGARVIADTIKTELKYENQKNYWDDQARRDFPVKDPRFQAQLKKSWDFLIERGLDKTHPKAVYGAAEHAAMVLGLNKNQAQTADSAKTNNMSSEVSSTEPRDVTKKSKISDSDPRLALWQAIHGNDKKKVEEYRKYLEKLDANPKRRRSA